MSQNYPNPFNPTTQIRFAIPKTSNVTLKIYNSVDQLVRTLVDGNMSEGYHQLTWDATDNFVEVRHRTWSSENIFEIFKQLNVSYAIIDQPPIGYALPFKPVATNDNVYIRFHGRNKQAWQKSINNFGKEQTSEEKNARYNYLYSPGELKEFELAIEQLLKDTAKDVYILFNNHPHGQSAANAFEFISYLEERLVEIPKTTLKAFPQLSKFSIIQQ